MGYTALAVAGAARWARRYVTSWRGSAGTVLVLLEELGGGSERLARQCKERHA